MIAVGSDSRAQAVKELNERHVIQAGKNRNGTQFVFRALDARASSAVLACTSNHSQDHGFVSCATHQQPFKRELATQSVEGEVSTTDPSYRVEFLGQTQHNYQKEDATTRCTMWKEWC